MVKIGRQPAGCRVAIVAVIARRNMSWMLACSRRAIVAGPAAANDLRVIDRIGGRKGVGVMAVFADVARLYMTWALAHGIDAVMAARTVSGDSRMIEVCGPPGDGRVAIVTGVAACNMGRVLASCDNAIMAIAAGPDDLRVINGEDWREYIGVVTVFANISCLNVSRRFANSIDSVVTVNTVTRDIHMVKIRRQPAQRRVAVIAGIATGDMSQVLASRGNAVMT